VEFACFIESMSVLWDCACKYALFGSMLGKFHL
jgi:hypothetical protein